MKTEKLLTTLAIVLVVLIAGCKKDDFKEVPGVCPIVVSTDPANGATGVHLDKIITATFNEKMNPLTITQASFTVQGASEAASAVTVTNTDKEIPESGTVTKKFALPAGTSVVGEITYLDKTATISPGSALLPNTSYTGKITTAVKDLNGNSLQKDYLWTFTTGTLPAVISTDPVNNATNVVLNKIVTATFSVPMDPLTLTGTTFTVKQGTTSVAGTVSYTGSTAFFTPSSDLLQSTVYTATITTGATNVAGIPLPNNYVWTFNTGATPSVISTDPANLATDIVLNKIVTATFSAAMDPLTITGTSFTVKQGAATVAGTVSYAGTTASFTPSSNLSPSTLYTATITTGAKSVPGIPMAANYVWTFTTGALPTVISTDPLDLATNVVLNKTVTATFGAAMDPLTINGTSFTLKQGVNPVAGTVTYVGTTASFDPTSDLLPSTLYTATITTGAKNVPGIPMASDFVWTFTTGAISTVLSTDPLDLATGVALNKTVTADFSVAMDPLTITGTTFTLKQGVNPVAGSVSYAGTTASFNPTSDLSPGLVYTATITTGAKTVPGIPLASDYVWTFTTSNVPPTVILTDPLNLATGVALNKTVTADFSTAMDPLTITGTSFTLKQGAASVAGSVSYLGTTASFDPTSDLLAGLVYTATITTDAKNVSGIPLVSDYVWTFTTLAAAPLGPGIVNLGTAGDFVAIGKSGISTTGVSSITGDIGVSPAAATAITGFALIMDATNQFSTSLYVNAPGKVYAADYAPPTPVKMTTAISDMETALTAAMGMTTGVINELGAGDISGMTLVAGLYKWTTGLSISNVGVTLTGGPNDTWVFQISQDLTVANGAIITLAGGAQAKNIFWITNTQAILGTTVDFSGNILAQTLISLNTGAKVTGRLLSQTAVTLNAATVIKP